MLLPDVNVWVTALLKPDHAAENLCNWLQDLLSGPEDVGTTDGILVSLVRVATAISDMPLDVCIEFADVVRTAPACEVLDNGPEFWPIFVALAKRGDFRGRVLSDVAIGAIAKANHCTVLTYDRDYLRFPGVQIQAPPV